MFFVAGITGHVGGAAARHLLDEGHKVRTLARNPQKADQWSKKGVDIRQGDFNDTAVLAAALEGVEGAFLMLPPLIGQAPGFPESKAIIASFREALQQTPPLRLVLLSSVGSQQSSGTGLIAAAYLLEQALANLSFPTAFLRPGSFFENYTYGLQMAASGWFDTFLTPTDRPVPMVATEDIGVEISRLLIKGWSGKKVIELGSRISPDDLAHALCKVLDRPVKARAIPRHQWTATLKALGMPPGAAALFEEMEDGMNSGWIDFGVPDTEPVSATVTPAQFFEQANKG